MQKKILVVAAHPDDEVLGCGGTIARLAQEGNDVYVAILGEGITSRYESQKDVDEKLVDALRKHAHEVSNILGVKELFLYNLPDNRFDTLPLLDIVKKIEGLIEKIKPEIIFTHYDGDLNIDHVLTVRAVLTATRPLPEQIVRKIYAFEIPSSTEWSFSQTVRAFSPNVFMDISSDLEKKLEAMQVYESESRTFPHPRSPEAIQALSKYRGSQSGLKAAEAFCLIREICEDKKVTV
ncbi:MAG: PIG-L family deacetylase [Planctomycetes bacterium]|nr:PIG-L family deacetylase [Planctomycetota bacterium]